MEGIPIVRLEIESMRHSIVTALTQEALKLDTDIQAAIEKALQPENVKRVIEDAVKSTAYQVIAEEIHNAFRFGKGRAIIRTALREWLDLQEGKTEKAP